MKELSRLNANVSFTVDSLLVGHAWNFSRFRLNRTWLPLSYSFARSWEKTMGSIGFIPATKSIEETCFASQVHKYAPNLTAVRPSRVCNDTSARIAESVIFRTSGFSARGEISGIKRARFLVIVGTAYYKTWCTGHSTSYVIKRMFFLCRRVTN